MFKVLNLVINGLPSILRDASFEMVTAPIVVLNLVINGLPSIPLVLKDLYFCNFCCFVLNLVINGLPSILLFFHLVV